MRVFRTAANVPTCVVIKHGPSSRASPFTLQSLRATWLRIGVVWLKIWDGVAAVVWLEGYVADRLGCGLTPPQSSIPPHVRRMWEEVESVGDGRMAVPRYLLHSHHAWVQVAVPHPSSIPLLPPPSVRSEIGSRMYKIQEIQFIPASQWKGAVQRESRDAMPMSRPRYTSQCCAGLLSGRYTLSHAILQQARLMRVADREYRGLSLASTLRPRRNFPFPIFDQQ